MSKDPKKPDRPRVPFPDKGLQVNFCKNHRCRNFGRPASSEKQPKGPGAKNKPGRDLYIVSAHGKNKPRLECVLCGQKPPMKSNVAVNEELSRFSEFLELAPLPTCPNPECENHTVTLKHHPKEYYKHTKTKAGSKRYRCKKCGKTLTIPAPNRYQKQPHITLEVFRLLVIKVPLRKICKKTGISTGSLYAKIDYIHRQCLKFVANREWKLLEGMKLKPLRISVDRQEYMVNWSERSDRRTTILQAVGSAENKARYVFGMHLNFDPILSQEEVDEWAEDNSDLELPKPFRRFARIWLKQDYEDSLLRKSPQPEEEGRGKAREQVRTTYQNALDREEIEEYEKHTAHTRLPTRGVQTHSDYTLYAHFLYLRRLLKGSPHITFYMDQEPGIRAACFAAFWERILERTCDAFYVKINKTLDSDDLDINAQLVRRDFLDYVSARPYLDLELIPEIFIKHRMMVDRLKTKRAEGPWNDPWIDHPYPLKNEPELQACHLTEDGGYSDRRLGWMYLMASLRGIDGFFQKVRRDMSPLERSAPTAGSNRKIWYGYAPYNPAMVQKLLDIYRVFYNYIEVGKDKKTPAMRLGLAQTPMKHEDILYFNS